MHAAPFRYEPVDTTDAAVAALVEHGDEASLLAGGQSLVPMMGLRLATPEVLVDISRIDWGQPRVDDHRVVIPAGVTHSCVIADEAVVGALPIIGEVGANIGNRRVRNRGTFGGSIAHADPAAEWPCLVTALGATIGLQGPSGRREVPASDFFRGFLDTAREPDEVVVDVTIPTRRPGTGHAHASMARRANDFSVVQVVAVADRTDVRLCFAGVGQAPVSTTAEEQAALSVADLTVDDLGAWVGSVVDRFEPTGDNHGPASFRRHLARSLGVVAATAALDDRNHS